jgi:4-aminobutyrate aminotransferase / (S)-3-amino-2-methylpropionate transaminase / 5-aminovalerate transaminase
VRGLGGMQAIELVQSQETKTPAAEETKRITQYCYEHGLITITAGSYSNVIRVLVPLVATNEQIDEGLGVLESAIASVSDQKNESTQYPVFSSQ